MGRVENERIAQVDRCIPGAWDYKEVLYIGASVDRFHFRRQLPPDMTVVEVDHDRFHELYDKFPEMDVLYKDVLEVAEIFRAGAFEATWWLHGPSVLRRSLFEPAMEAIEAVSRCLVVVSCPWGEYQYDPGRKVKKEDKNITALYPIDFMRLGYKVDCIGIKDTTGSNLLAWKRLATFRS